MSELVLVMAMSLQATGSNESGGDDDRGADKIGQTEGFTDKFHDVFPRLPVSKSKPRQSGDAFTRRSARLVMGRDG